MRLIYVDNTIVLTRPGWQPKVVQVLSPAYAAYVEARAGAHQEIGAGELSGAAALRLGQTCRLIIVKEPRI